MHMHIHLSAISGWNCKLENRTTRKKNGASLGRGPITNTGAKGGLLSFGKTCGVGCRVDYQPLFGK